MTAADRCTCCDLPVASCGRAVEQRERAEAAERRRTLIATRRYRPAEFPGACHGCGEWFKAGDLITPVHVIEDGQTQRRWQAGDCCGPTEHPTPKGTDRG